MLIKDNGELLTCDEVSELEGLGKLILLKTISQNIKVFRTNNLHGYYHLIDPKIISINLIKGDDAILLTKMAFYIITKNESHLEGIDLKELYLAAKIYAGPSIDLIVLHIKNMCNIDELMIALIKDMIPLLNCTLIDAPEDVNILISSLVRIFPPSSVSQCMYLVLSHCVNTLVFDAKDPSPEQRRILGHKWLRILSYAAYITGFRDNNGIWTLLWYFSRDIDILDRKPPLSSKNIPAPDAMEIILFV